MLSHTDFQDISIDRFKWGGGEETTNIQLYISTGKKLFHDIIVDRKI